MRRSFAALTNAFMMASSRVVSRMQKGVGDEASRRRVSAGDEEHEEQEAEMRELRGGGSEEGSERMGLLLGRW